MMGKVRFATHRGEPAEAFLDETGHWHCPSVPVLVRVLDALYDPNRVAPEAGTSGQVQLHAAARWLKGSVESGDSADLN